MSGSLRAVVFDVGGVMCPDPVSEFVRIDVEHGLPDGTTMAVFRGGGLFAQCEVGLLAFADFCAGCSAVIERDHGVLVPPRRFEAMFDAIMGEAVRPEMLALGLEVKRAGYLVGLLTNIFAERREWLHGLFPEGTVDVYADSSEIGHRKPNKEIYDALVDRLGVSAHEIAFVDDFSENLRPAHELGMTTILFESPTQVRRELVAAGVRIAPVAAAETAELLS